jgi:adenylate cyclase
VRQIGGLRLVLTLMCLVTAVLFARFSWMLPLAIDAESILYDFRSAAVAPATEQDDRIVLVVYDDDTLIQTRRRSPLDRTVLARALTRLDALGAKSIGVDILIDQPQPEDASLSTALRALRTPTWLAYANNAAAPDKINWEQQRFLEGFLESVESGHVRPASILMTTERDNVLRRWPDSIDTLPPLLPDALVRGDNQALAGRSIAWKVPVARDREIFAALPVQTLADDRIFDTPEARALLASQVAGRHVLVGGHIQDIDLFESPVGRVTGKPIWGIDAFAQMLAQKLDGRAYAPVPDWVLWLAAFAVVVAAVLTALTALPPLAAFVALVVQLAVLGGLPFALHARMIETFGLPVFGWSAGWMIAYLAAAIAARAVGSEQRRFAQSALGKYLPRDIAAQILRDPEGLSLKGEKRELFIVFSDLEGFTGLSHVIEPEVVATVLNRYLELMSTVVLDHGGTIDKFVGDAVVAFWGAPIARPDDGTRATHAAIAMHKAGEDFRQSIAGGMPAIGRTRVGLHCGEAVVGNFGGEGRIQYTALGDAMNTASRLESANKQLGTSVLMSREAADRSGATTVRALGTVVLRGRATPIDIVEPSGAAPDDLARFAQLVDAAQHGDTESLRHLETMAVLHPNDAVLRNLIYRLGHRSEGGFYVLD